MSKDAYYFPHDSNAKDDPKCVLLIEQLGMEGYGIYWMLVETLRDQPEYTYPVALLPALARRYNTTPEKVKTVVCNYGLFMVKDDTIFFSQSLNDRMAVLERKREQNRQAGLKSAEKRMLMAATGNGCSTDVQHSLNDCSTSKVKKSKVKESKEKNYSLGFVDKKFEKAITDWLEYKSAKNQKYNSQRSIEALYQKLITLSNNNPDKARQIIEQSMANNWAGIFPLKTEANGSRTISKTIIPAGQGEYTSTI